MLHVIRTSKHIESEVRTQRLASLKQGRDKCVELLGDVEPSDLRDSIEELLANFNKRIKALEPPPP